MTEKNSQAYIPMLSVKSLEEMRGTYSIRHSTKGSKKIHIYIYIYTNNNRELDK